MITICCGDDTAASRTTYSGLRKREDAGDIIDLGTNISELKSAVESSASLFSERTTILLESVLSRKENREIISSYADMPNLDIIVWEPSMDERIIRMHCKKARILSHKLPVSLWKYLDGLYPGNLNGSLIQLHMLSGTVDDHMILYMTQRRAKDLILVKAGLDGKRKLAPWQKKIMSAQADKWNDAILKAFYNKLFEIEKGVKTNKLPYPIKNALDILFHFYLQ